MKRLHQKGVALLTTLLLTATLSVLALAMTDLLTRSLQKASAGELRDQAFWGLAGFETAALTYLERQAEVLDQPNTSLFSEPVIFPFDGVVVTIRFEDAGHCFNLNDLVAVGDDEGEGNQLFTDEAAVQRLAFLIGELVGDRSGGRQLAVRVADFIDSDRDPAPGSAEEFDYQTHEVPYRTSSAFLASVSELRAIAGFSRNIYSALAPWLCTLPTDGTHPLNVNTLTPADTPILLSLTGDALTPSAAIELLERRPLKGYEDVQEFLDHPLLGNLDLPPELSTHLSTSTGLIRMEIILENELGRLRQESLVWRGGAGLQVIERRVGERLP